MTVQGTNFNRSHQNNMGQPSMEDKALQARHFPVHVAPSLPRSSADLSARVSCDDLSLRSEEQILRDLEIFAEEHSILFDPTLKNTTQIFENLPLSVAESERFRQVQILSSKLQENGITRAVSHSVETQHERLENDNLNLLCTTQRPGSKEAAMRQDLEKRLEALNQLGIKLSDVLNFMEKNLNDCLRITNADTQNIYPDYTSPQSNYKNNIKKFLEDLKFINTFNKALVEDPRFIEIQNHIRSLIQQEPFFKFLDQLIRSWEEVRHKRLNPPAAPNPNHQHSNVASVGAAAAMPSRAFAEPAYSGTRTAPAHVQARVQGIPEPKPNEGSRGVFGSLKAVFGKVFESTKK